MDCLFCKIINGEIPSDKVYEDEFVYAFKDISPQAPVHILIIPKQHIDSSADINDTNSDIVAKIFEVAAYLAKELKLENALKAHPNKIEYSRPTMKYRHYGKTLERMIDVAVDMPEGEEKEQFLHLLISQMKKSYTQWNREVDDEAILEDLYELSDGKIKLDPDTYSIPSFRSQPTNPRQRTRFTRGQRRR